MAFEPPPPVPVASPLPPADADAVQARVAQAAEGLVSDLRRGAELSAGWTATVLADALIDDALGRCLAALDETGLRGPANRLPSSVLWRIAGDALAGGSLQNHARVKPHGYAGDYEMLTRIWQQTARGDALGQTFDRYFLRQAAPAAVRTRIEQAAGAVLAHFARRDAQRPFCIASVGAGPAIDVARALEAMSPDGRRAVEVTLLDIDPHALQVAAERVGPLLSQGALRTARANLLRLAKLKDLDSLLGRPDVLICTGLFDYLDQSDAGTLLAAFWRRLAPGGRMLVGNFAPHNPTRAYMEWIGNWYLIYRTPDDLRRLALTAGIPPERFYVGSERLGVDLFLVAGAD